MSSSATTMLFTLGTSTTGFTYKIKVAQIECFSLSLPPQDCAQYFTGISGTFNSYNYPTTMLALADYGTCFRKERGYCAISYGANQDTDTSTKGFDLAPSAGTETTTCSLAYVAIPNLVTTAFVDAKAVSESVTGIICGEYFNTQDSLIITAIGDGTAVQSSPPFVVQTRTDSATVATSLGYTLSWTQVPCGNSAI